MLPGRRQLAGAQSIRFPLPALRLQRLREAGQRPPAGWVDRQILLKHLCVISIGHTVTRKVVVSHEPTRLCHC